MPAPRRGSFLRRHDRERSLTDDPGSRGRRRRASFTSATRRRPAARRSARKGRASPPINSRKRAPLPSPEKEKLSVNASRERTQIQEALNKHAAHLEELDAQIAEVQRAPSLVPGWMERRRGLQERQGRDPTGAEVSKACNPDDHRRSLEEIRQARRECPEGLRGRDTDLVAEHVELSEMSEPPRRGGGVTGRTGRLESASPTATPGEPDELIPLRIAPVF